MPTVEHEVLILLFRNRPTLAAEVLQTSLGVTLPDFTHAKLGPTDLTECPPTEYQADAVVVLSSGDTPVLAVVVEVQRGKDSHKRWSWPVYLASVRARARCPALLLVICTERTVAQWCAAPIEMGHPGWRLSPIVAGPKSVPPVTDQTTASQAPELAVLSAIANSDAAEAEQVLEVLVPALAGIDSQQARLYADFVWMMLPETARKHMEVLMKTKAYAYQSEFAQKYVAEGEAKGEAKGKAEAILILLESRGITLVAEERSRVFACTDTSQLDEWIRRAATADSVDFLSA